jgi:hypothetical protein
LTFLLDDDRVITEAIDCGATYLDDYLATLLRDTD